MVDGVFWLLSLGCSTIQHSSPTAFTGTFNWRFGYGRCAHGSAKPMSSISDDVSGLETSLIVSFLYALTPSCKSSVY